MNHIGVFICNYNGKDWVLKCIDSLFRQSLQQFDLYVVDNASTDHTVEGVRERYGNRVYAIRNPENLGGAGGFNKGLLKGLEKGYRYIVLLDNDIVLDERALEHMKHFLDTHEDVGIVGAKVMIMDKPDTVQDFGNYLDFDGFKEINGHKWELDSERLPEVNECDYVPTCAVMIRADVLKHAGTMPEDNFIYYDDIELSYKIGLQGYRVAALGNARVWHKGGFRKVKVSTFPRYYFLRNRLHFFAKYIPEEKVDSFISIILSEIHAQLYGYYNKGCLELFRTSIYALDDFIHGVRGKAADDKILPIVERLTPFEQAIRGKKKIRIWFMDNFVPEKPLEIYHIFLYILANIQTRNAQKKIWVSLSSCGYSETEFREKWGMVQEMNSSEVPLPDVLLSRDDGGPYDLEFHMCEHVRMVTESVLPQIYIDQYCNCITSEEDDAYFKSCSVSEKIFTEIYRPLMAQAVQQIRKGGWA